MVTPKRSFERLRPWPPIRSSSGVHADGYLATVGPTGTCKAGARASPIRWVVGLQAEAGELRVLYVVCRESSGADEAVDVIYGGDGTMLGEVRMKVPRDCPIAQAVDGRYVFAALEGDEPRIYGHLASSAEGLDIHILKMDANVPCHLKLRWDPTVASLLYSSRKV